MAKKDAKIFPPPMHVVGINFNQSTGSNIPAKTAAPGDTKDSPHGAVNATNQSRIKTQQGNTISRSVFMVCRLTVNS